MEEEIYIELPKQVGLLKKAMYGLVHAGLLWSKKFGAEIKAKGFEQSQADPCVFRRVLSGKVVVIIVVYADDLLEASATERDEEQSLRDIRSCFPIKDLGGASYYLGCHITRDRDAETLKLDQHQHVQAVAESFGITKTSAIPSTAEGKPLSKADCPKRTLTPKECVRSPIERPSGPSCGSQQ